MSTTRLAVIGLRILLAAAFALLLVLQFMSFPGQFAHMAEEDPDMAHLRWPLTLLAGFELLCAQVVIVSTWKLLTLVNHNRIFSNVSMKWVDAIVGAIATGWVVFSGLFLYVGFNADDPGVPLLMFVFVVGGAVLGLLMWVMRALLHQATTLQTDLEEVI